MKFAARIGRWCRNHRRLVICSLLAVLFIAREIFSAGVVDIDLDQMALVDSVMYRAIDEEIIPGAVVAVVQNDEVVFLKAYGNKQLTPTREAMTTNTIFDLASCTKPVATAISAMQLVERGRLRLSDPVSRYLPDFAPWTDPETGEEAEATITDLMTHTSGLPAYASVQMLKERYGAPCPDSLKHHICTMRRLSAPATVFRYSCLNFIVLQYIIEAITGQSLAEYAQANIFAPLEMKHTSFLPPAEWKPMIAPTAVQPDGSVLLGEVHDPLARVLNGGVSGNAGLFSTAEDLAQLCVALQNEGEGEWERILSPASVRTMRSIPAGYEKFGRALGWDICSAYAGNKGNLFGAQAYGHTGFTGTSIVIDPETKTSLIVLTNAVHLPRAKSTVRLRAVVANIVAGAIRFNND